ncbi:MAG: HIT family protein [Burkholderiaceae bacterium]
MNTAGTPSCELCREPGGALVVQLRDCRIILPDEPDTPGFTRVVLQAHVREMTDLPRADRLALMEIVFGVEQVMRDTLAPDKVNLASLGNQVDHLHWHVIPRYRTDARFPAPVWAAAQRAATKLPGEPAVARYRSALQKAFAPH